MEMSLSQAAQAAKRTRQCLASAIKKGRLAATKDANGEWKIDSAELIRVYPDCDPLQQTSTPTKQVIDNKQVVEVAVLRERLAAIEAAYKVAEDRRREAETRLAKTERELDAERERFDNYVRALPAGRSVSPEAPVAPIPMPAMMETATTAGKASERPVQASEAASQGEGHAEGEKGKRRGFWASIFHRP